MPKTIITRTPLRITFVGGGTDIPAFYEKHGGACINATIDKYVTVTVRAHLGHPRSLHSDTVKAALEMTGVSEVCVSVEKDISVAGLGTSSAVCVGLLKALYALKDQAVTSSELAEQAYTLEHTMLKHAGGKQDQYAAAFGGMNYFEFLPDGRVKNYSQIALDAKEFILFNTGEFRDRTTQAPHDSLDTEKLIDLQALTKPCLHALGRRNVGMLGSILAVAWQAKRETHATISTAKIDKLYRAAIDLGAWGGKLLGGGGGGAMLFIAPIETHESIISGLLRLGCTHIPFNFESLGSHEIIP